MSLTPCQSCPAVVFVTVGTGSDRVAVVVSCGAPGEAPLLRRVYTCVDPDVAPVGTHVVVLLNAKRRSAEASDGIVRVAIAQ